MLKISSLMGFVDKVKGEIMPDRERAPVKIRTSNLLIRSQMLYPVELRAPEGC